MTSAKFYFANVDIDLTGSAAAIALLHGHLEKSISVLFHAQGRLRFEIGGSWKNADALTHKLHAMIAAFPPDVRAAWDGCSQKLFDIGVNLTGTVFSHEFSLTPKTVELIASLGMSIVFTCYPPVPDCQPRQEN